MKRYVAGLLFNDLHVALIEKQKPAWQAGKLNGIGGSIETGETPADAMVREFREETGERVAQWRYFCRLRCASNDWEVLWFTARGYVPIRSTTIEKVDWYSIHHLADYPIIPNLHWLIPLALHEPDGLAEVWVS